MTSLQAQMYYTQVLVGDYKYSTRKSDELGWLQCDGRLLDRTIYSALFNIIGTAFGSTNSTNFRLQYFRGRVPGDAGSAAGLSIRNLGDKVGAETHVLTVNEMPSHDSEAVMMHWNLSFLHPMCLVEKTNDRKREQT